MAISNFTGFETNDYLEVVSSTGTTSIVTSLVRTGTYALRTNPTTTGTGYVELADINNDGASASNCDYRDFTTVSIVTTEQSRIRTTNALLKDVDNSLTHATDALLRAGQSRTHVR